MKKYIMDPAFRLAGWKVETWNGGLVIVLKGFSV